MEGLAFRKAMRGFAGTVSIVATGSPGSREGITATSVCSLSDDPPSVLVCVNHASRANSEIRRIGRFSLNVLAAGQSRIAEHFAGRTGIRGDARFSAGQWMLWPSGTPHLLDAAIAFDCVLAWDKAYATHSIFCGEVCEVVAMAVPSPLVYLNGRFGAVYQANLSFNSVVI